MDSDPAVVGADVAPPSPVGGRRLVRSGAFVLAMNAFGRLATFATTIAVSRELAVGDFGVYAFGVAFGSMFAVFVDLGLDAIATRELAASDPDRDGSIVGSTFVVKGALAALVTVAAVATSALYEADLRRAALIGTVTIVATLPSTFGLVLSARLRMTGVMVAQVVGSLLTLAVTALALTHDATAAQLVAIVVAGAAVSSIGVAGLGRRVMVSRLSIDRDVVRSMVRQAAPLAVSSVAVLLYRRIDQLMLGALGTREDLGTYAAAVRLVDALNLFPTAAATVMLPALSHITFRGAGQDRADELAARGYRLLACVIVPIAAAGVHLSGSVLAGLFGDSYRDAGATLAVLLWAHVFAFLGSMVAQVLVTRSLTGSLAVLTVAGAVVNISANVFVIPRYGGIGASITSLVAYSIPFVVGSAWGPARDVFRRAIAACLRPLIAGALTVAVLAPFRGNDVALGLLFVVAAPVALLVTGSLGRDEIRQLALALLPHRRQHEEVGRGR